MDRLVHGDCIEHLRALPDKAVTLLLTDPPYGLNMARRGQIGGGGRVFTPKDWDVAPPAQEYFDEMRRVSKHQIIWGGNMFSHLLPQSRCWLVWYKKDGLGRELFCRLRARVDLLRSQLDGVQQPVVWLCQRQQREALRAPDAKSPRRDEVVRSRVQQSRRDDPRPFLRSGHLPCRRRHALPPVHRDRQGRGVHQNRGRAIARVRAYPQRSSSSTQPERRRPMCSTHTARSGEKDNAEAGRCG